MRLLLTVWFFYRKLLIPLSVASALIGALSVITDKHFSFQSAGISFLIFSPVFQYLIYDVMYPEAYLFYHNLGLKKEVLWIINLLAGTVVWIILRCL